MVNKINNHELSKFNNTTDFNNSSVINVYPDTSNLGNNSGGKYNKSNVLFNDILLNQSHFNKSFKVFALDKDVSVNDNLIGLSKCSIIKKLNTSKLNNSICNDSREDDFLINPVPESDNKDYNIMFLILPVLLILLGAIILYKKSK